MDKSQPNDEMSDAGLASYVRLLPRVVTLEERMSTIHKNQQATSAELSRFEERMESRFDLVAKMLQTSTNASENLSAQLKSLSANVGDLQGTMLNFSTSFAKMSASIDADSRINKERWDMWERSCTARHEVVKDDITRVRNYIDDIEGQMEDTGRHQIQEATAERGATAKENQRLRSDIRELRAAASAEKLRAENAEKRLLETGEAVRWWRSNTFKLIVVILGMLGAGGAGAKVMEIINSQPPAATP